MNACLTFKIVGIRIFDKCAPQFSEADDFERMDRMRVGVVGLGYFSQFHLIAWRDLAGCDLVGVSDLDPALTRDVARNFDTAAFDNVADLLEADPEIIDLVVPPPAHAALIRQCLAPGRLIICQKPFCTSLGEAKAITEEAERAGATLIIHENFRFQPWHRTVKALLDDGRLGQIYSARFALRPGDGRGAEAYLARQPGFQQMKRFLVQETAVHFIDLFRWFFGEIGSVFADLRQLNPHIAGEDAGILTFGHTSGVRSVFDGNRLADHVSDNPRRTMGEMEIVAEHGTLVLDGAGRIWLRKFGARNFDEISLVAAVDETSFGGGCVAALIQHAVQAHQGRHAHANLARDYLDVIRVCDAAYQSNEEERRIDLN